MTPQIAVIDSGINSKIVKCESKDRLNKGIQDRCGHGTACAMVISKICPEAEIISIPLLNENAQASNGELECLLEYCLELDCDIINLSLSVVDNNADRLNKICKKIRNKGKIIVASVTNRKSESIPAIYDSVLGVRGKIFESTDAYWFSPNKKIQMIADMTPVFTNPLLGKYFVFSGNSKATAVASALVANILKHHGRLNHEEILYFLTSNALKTEWGKLTIESQLSSLIGEKKYEENEIIQIVKIIKPIIMEHFAIKNNLKTDENLFCRGIITADSINKLLKEISRYFKIDINYLNITPKDIITVNNLSAAVRRICDEKANGYL